MSESELWDWKVNAQLSRALDVEALTTMVQHVWWGWGFKYLQREWERIEIERIRVKPKFLEVVEMKRDPRMNEGCIDL